MTGPGIVVVGILLQGSSQPLHLVFFRLYHTSQAKQHTKHTNAKHGVIASATNMKRHLNTRRTSDGCCFAKTTEDSSSSPNTTSTTPWSGSGRPCTSPQTSGAAATKSSPPPPQTPPCRPPRHRYRHHYRRTVTVPTVFVDGRQHRHRRACRGKNKSPVCMRLCSPDKLSGSVIPFMS